ncbi:MAG: type II toxin-antitoxin system prevent-host-death family antitoxin [Saccharofermentanales bacterium]
MISTATEMKNNFAQYLKHVVEENAEVIITKNNQKVARLVPYVTDLDKYFKLEEKVSEYRYDKLTVSYDEFMEIYENSNSRMEYINGVIWLMGSPSMNHQVLLGKLHVIFNQYFIDKKCKPFLAPFDVHFRKVDIDVPDVMQPDLLVICDFEGNINEKDKFMGTPTLVLEILSKSTRSKDMVYKLNTYLTSGVGEYWIIDPNNNSILVYVFKDYKIDDFSSFRIGDIAKSGIFDGLDVDVNKLFESIY